MDAHLHFIVNKQSKKSDRVFKSLLLELPKYTLNYKLYLTNNISELDKLLSMMRKTIAKNDIIVVVGGDGSLNQFVTLYKKYDFNNCISYIPSGSGNDFARAHNIPFNTKKALKHLFQVKEKQNFSFIYGKENSTKHYAVNSIGIGIDGLINELVNSKGVKENLGALSYLSVLFSAYRQQNKFPATLKVDQGEYIFENAQLVLIANNPFFGGGIRILPDADGKDEILDILIADDVSLWHLFSILLRALTGNKHLNHPNLHSFQSKKVELQIDSDEYAQKDGEVFKQKSYDYHFHVEEISFWI